MIPVTPYPLRDSYDSFDEAVAANERTPLQARARADTQLLRNSQLSAHAWSDASCSLYFSNGRSLIVHVAVNEVDWGVSDKVSSPAAAHAPPSWGPVTLSWAGLTEPVEFDPNSLLSELHGSPFDQLYYLADLGWLALYSRGHEPVSFYVLRRDDTGQNMLYVGWLG